MSINRCNGNNIGREQVDIMKVNIVHFPNSIYFGRGFDKYKICLAGGNNNGGDDDEPDEIYAVLDWLHIVDSDEVVLVPNYIDDANRWKRGHDLYYFRKLVRVDWINGKRYH